MEGAPSAQRQLELARVVSLLKVLATAKKLNEDREPIRFSDKLFVGSIGAAHNKAGLQQAGITHVLCVAGGLPLPFPDLFSYLTIEINDSPSEDILAHFERCFEFISSGAKAGGGVLVHCFAGKSRSVTVLLAYMMRQTQCTLQAAISAMQQVRPSACPNSGFMEQLRAFEQREADRRGGRGHVYHTRLSLQCSQQADGEQGRVDAPERAEPRAPPGVHDGAGHPT